MARLHEYTEVLEFRVYLRDQPGEHKVLLPSELDLAIKRMMVSEQEAELDRLENQPEPPAIVKARAEIAGGKLEGTPLDMARAQVMAYESRRMGEVEGYQTARWRTERQLQRMEEQVDHPEDLGGDPEFLRFQMREFSQGERIAADDEHSALEDVGGQRMKSIDIPARNLTLLSTCLLGEWVPEEQVDAIRVTKDFDGQPYVLEDAGDPRNLQQTIAQILIDRMWAKNTMAPELAGFFGRRPRRSP